MFGRTTISIDQLQAQSRINAQLPKEVFKGGTVTDTQVVFNEHDLETTITLKGNKFGKNFTLLVTAVGVPEYRRAEGAFYFRPSQITIKEFSYDHSGQLANKLKVMADKYVTNTGVRQAITDAAPHLETWMTEAAQKGATSVLQRVPVYRLKDDIKGLLIQASLESLQLEDAHIKIVVSFWSLTKWVVALLLMALVMIAIIIGLITHPDMMKEAFWLPFP